MIDPPASRLIPALPDDIAILCIARVPRSHHAFLAAVSRAWRAALRSPLLFSTRREIAASQHFLLFNVRTPADQFRWYLLDRLCRNNSLSLIPLSDPPLSATPGCAVVTIAHSLFLLGGNIDGKSSRAVQIYDARFNCWRIGVPMIACREYAAAGVVAGRIYAFGGCHRAVECWAEEFDLEKGEWRRVPSPLEIREKWMHGNAVIGGKLLAVSDRGGIVFDPAMSSVESEKLHSEKLQMNAWNAAPMLLELSWRGRVAAIGEVLYLYDSIGKIIGYDMEEKVWKIVEGVDEELPMFCDGATMSNLGEVLCLLWEGRRRSKEADIICTGIRVTRTNNGGLQGTIQWSETIALAIPSVQYIANCISLEF